MREPDEPTSAAAGAATGGVERDGSGSAARGPGAVSLAQCIGYSILYLVLLVAVLFVDWIFFRAAFWRVLAPAPPLMMAVMARRRRQWRFYVICWLTAIAATALASMSQALADWVIAAFTVVWDADLPS